MVCSKVIDARCRMKKRCSGSVDSVSPVSGWRKSRLLVIVPSRRCHGSPKSSTDTGITNCTIRTSACLPFSKLGRFLYVPQGRIHQTTLRMLSSGSWTRARTASRLRLKTAGIRGCWMTKLGQCWGKRQVSIPDREFVLTTSRVSKNQEIPCCRRLI